MSLTPDSAYQASLGTRGGTVGGMDESPTLDADELPVGALPVPPVDREHGGLHRGLSARQVSMIAIAGTIGTGLFLGTGRSLAQGGPASMLIW